MKIAVLSGKGGTGKTMLSVNLSYISSNAYYVDCDVEEPNGLLFFKTEEIDIHNVYNKIPVIDHDLCVRCRKCSDFCQFNALAFINGKIHLFPDLCHACGGCSLVCPVDAIREKDRILGRVYKGSYQHVAVLSGELNIGEQSGIPIIKSLMSMVEEDKNVVIFDAPPGNGCPVMETISDVDYCVLVAEPSVFGLHNLKMVYELVEVFGKKAGIVINKANNHAMIHDFAKAYKIPIIGEIPMDKEIGRLLSEGVVLAENEKYVQMFQSIMDKIDKVVKS